MYKTVTLNTDKNIHLTISVVGDVIKMPVQNILTVVNKVL